MDMPYLMAIPVAVQFTVHMVLDCSNTEIIHLNPTQGMAACMCVFFCVVLSCLGRGLEMGQSPSPRSSTEMF
jgi:hypothetical protein